MRYNYFLYLLLLMLSFRPAWAQQDSTKRSFTDNLYFSAQYSSGFLVAHRGSLESLVNTYTSSFQIEVGKTTYGKKAWEQLYHYPNLGIGYYQGNLGNNEVFGNTKALYGFIEAPYFPEKKVSFGYKFGFGLAYLSKSFDIDENIYNIAIGSHVNFLIHFAFDIKLNLLEDKLFIKTGLGFKHMSNGKIQAPNLGLNIVDWHLTAGYYIGKRVQHISKALPIRDKHTFMGIIAGGPKEFTNPDLGKYFGGNATIEYEYSIQRKVSVGLGADIFYDGVIREEMLQKEDPKAGMHAVRAGIHATYVIYYHKIGFIVQMGSYIEPYSKDDGYLYHRVGFRAKITDHLLANVTMKTHWARASIVEVGLGYYFSK